MAAACADPSDACIVDGHVEAEELLPKKIVLGDGSKSSGSASTVDDDDDASWTDSGLEASSDDDSSESLSWSPVNLTIDSLADLELESIICSRRWHGDSYYLVRWVGIDAALWMLEDDLLDTSACPKVLRFRQQQAALAKRRSTPLFPKQETDSPRKAMMRDARRRWTSLGARRCASGVTELFNDFMSEIEAAFRCSGSNVVQVENICDPSRLADFEKGVDMVFHGTSALRLESIIENGLLVPGHGEVTVVNGSAHGVGIYTASSPQLHYARDFASYMGSNFQMLCCAARPGTAYRAGGFMIFDDRENVLPCFLVTATRDRHICETRASYSPSLTSDLPMGVVNPETESKDHVMPLQGRLFREAHAVGVKRTSTAMCMPRSKRIPYVIRGDHLEDEQVRATWFSRDRRSLTAAQLRALPRSAKLPWREGRIHTPKLDQTRQDKSRRVKATRSALTWKSTLIFSGP